MKKLFLLSTLLLITLNSMAQVTSSGINGKVSDGKEDIIGATITARHVPTGAVYYAVTNIDGVYSITGMKAGVPSRV